jgi:hypothetical protein
MNMNKVKLNTKSKYKNGMYTLKNPSKYVGDVNNVIYRSSWEKRMCMWLDTQENVVFWSSELLVIPYFDTYDKKMHNYHTDFTAKIRTKTGELKTYVLELKPEKEIIKPTTKNKKRLMIEIPTYIKNQCKWNAAKIFCEERGATFIVLSEYDIGIKTR